MNEIVNKSTIYNGKIITVEKKQLKLPNGVIVDRKFVDHKPAATMLAIIDNAVVLVSQYRIGSNSQLLELPAGLMENGENPLACAKRELQEEIGYKANSIELLGKYYLSPGFCNELIYLFLCTDLTPSKLPQDDDEFLSIHFLPINEIENFLNSNKCNDIKTALGLSLLLNKITSRR